MRVYTKIGNRLYEGNVIRKRNTLLREDDVAASLDSEPSIRQAQVDAQKKIHGNPSVTAATIDAGKADGQHDTNSAEGSTFEVPINASSSELDAAQKMANQQSMDDMQIRFVDPKAKQEGRKYRKDTIYEMRRSGIRFSKKEFSDFLKKL